MEQIENTSDLIYVLILLNLCILCTYSSNSFLHFVVLRGSLWVVIQLNVLPKFYHI